MHLKPQHLPKAAVLVLEEDPFLRAGLCSLVAKAGYVLAEDPGDANPTRSVDLVLAGIGASQVLPRQDRAAPLILLVDHGAWSGLDFLDTANAVGAAAVLPRPFSRFALLSLMAKVLAQSLSDEAERAELPNPTEPLIYFDNPNFA